ncbi:hypothetical protein [Pullulanibacillus pueri]|uniref:hypothetical protein n=1 Tax=Pullulanibacillus pueri TaxID=1437324 RepID=UPI0019578888|nr:hypothetical protein [Pullulanibacillus pueri]
MPGPHSVGHLKAFLPKCFVSIKWIGAEDARLLREQHVSEDPLGKLDYHPKLAEATKDDRLKTSRPVTTPTLPTSCGHEESERSEA